MEMKIDFSQMVVDSSVNIGKHRKEKNFYKTIHLVGLVENEIRDLAEVRFYGTGSTNTAILWIHSPILGLYGSTYGKAGGYGYNREDAAFQQAVDAMYVNYTGYLAPRTFFERLAQHLGVSVFTIIESAG